MSELIANRYRVLGELGRGNMGAVYRVADTLEGDRLMALKVIQAPGAITPELRLLFKEEFRAMTKLRHPNTISVFGYGELDEKSQYLTMEIVPGAELADVIGRKPMALDAVYPLLVQLLQALGFIHSRLYVHHDIKAQNIRLRDDGTLKLMDFGLMCQLGRPALGRRVTGTPGYLPPEIVKGGVINASTD
ncbi:MAG: serine/threonine protein kinase, partial [Candidatus Sericytochromatia bacterium]